jgi:predicted DNA-binding transcriptional regulator YafY
MKTKQSAVREMVIDRCLRSRQRYSTADIMKAVNAELEARGEAPVKSRHTILDDIYSMADRWKIVVDSVRIGRVTYWSYRDPDFTIYELPLSDDEIVNLTSTIFMLKRFQGLPNFGWIQDLIDNCKSNFKAVREEKEFVSLEDNPYARGLDHLTPLYEAIVNQKVLDIWYHSFRYPSAQKNTIHPYYLKQFNNRWFLFCYNDFRKEISNYPLDRIEKIEYNDKRYIENTFVDFKEFFDDMVGVSREKDSQLEKVLIWISARQWPYFETKPIHGSQKVKERREDGSVVIELEVIINWELEQLIMSQVEHMCVLSPESLRNKIKDRIKLLQDLYI